MIIKFHDLAKIRDNSPEKIIVFAGGTFDLLHTGHVEFLKKLRNLGDIVVVAISSDRRVRDRKGKHRPVHDQRTRVTVVDAIRYVDYTLIAPYGFKQKEAPTIQIIKRLRPDIFVTRDRKWIKFADIIYKYCPKLEIDTSVKRNSTSRIIKKVTVNNSKGL